MQSGGSRPETQGHCSPMMAVPTLSGQALPPHAGLSHSCSLPNSPFSGSQELSLPSHSSLPPDLPRLQSYTRPHPSDFRSPLYPPWQIPCSSVQHSGPPWHGLSYCPVIFPSVPLDASSTELSTHPFLKPSLSLMSLLKLFLLLGVASPIPSHLTTPPPPAHYLYRHEC